MGLNLKVIIVETGVFDSVNASVLFYIIIFSLHRCKKNKSVVPRD